MSPKQLSIKYFFNFFLKGVNIGREKSIYWKSPKKKKRKEGRHMNVHSHMYMPHFRKNVNISYILKLTSLNVYVGDDT